jgi:hypothetical protein
METYNRDSKRRRHPLETKFLSKGKSERKHEKLRNIFRFVYPRE